MAPKKNQKKGGASKNTSKAASKVPSRQDTPLPGTPAEPEQVYGTTIVGINFGQTASSVALINKEGHAEAIANDDGDRQIATAVSFAGDQTYIGNPARIQLVRNNENTILGFRDLLGKSYEDVKSIKPLFNSAPIVEKDGQPAFTVQISETATTFTASEIATSYLQTLISYAQDFVGRKIDAVVFALPEDFTPTQTAALADVAKAAGVQTLQFVSEASAVAVAYGLTEAKDGVIAPAGAGSKHADSNVVVVDVGGSSTTVTVLAARGGLYVPLSTVRDSTVGGDQLDARLIEHFSKEFTKKTKTPLDADNHRAVMKLRLAAEVTKRSLSASSSANCSVESLAEGMDFSGNVNRMRFDLLAAKVYAGIVKVVEDAVAKSGLEKERIDQAILVGGSTKLPSIGDKVLTVLSPSTKITMSLEPDEAVAMGCALHALHTVTAYPLDSPSHTAEYEASLKADHVLETSSISQPLGLLFPASKDTPGAVDGKLFVVLADTETPLPLKRTFELPLAKSGSGKIVVDLWQGTHDILVEDPPKPAANGKAADSDDDEEEDDSPVRTAVVKPTHALAHVELPQAKAGGKAVIVLSVDESGKGKFAVRTGAKAGEDEVVAEF